MVGLMLVGAVVAGTIPATGTPRGGGVQLLKIQFDPPGDDNGSNGSLNAEAITIVNRVGPA